MCGTLQVPVIAVFTKYDQFRREIRMKLEDQSRDPVDLDDNAEAEKIFNERYLANLGGPPPAPFVCLESKDLVNQPSTYSNCSPVGMHKPRQRCTNLIEKTADALSGSTVNLMLLAVQKHNLELNIKHAVKWQVTMYHDNGMIMG
jgi:hypothetical protein